MPRERLAQRLVHLVEQVAEGYCIFAAGAAPTDSKAFAAHHAACKSALSHLDLLLRLTRAIIPETPGEPHPSMLIADARRALLHAAPDLELTAEEVEPFDFDLDDEDDNDGGPGQDPQG